jgi:hypothetical protein
VRADTIAPVADERLRRRILHALAHHLGRAVEDHDVVTDGEGRFMVTTEGEMWILATLAGPVTRLVDHPGIGRVAESWRNGFCGEMAVVAG